MRAAEEMEDAGPGEGVYAPRLRGEGEAILQGRWACAAVRGMRGVLEERDCFAS